MENTIRVGEVKIIGERYVLPNFIPRYLNGEVEYAIKLSELIKILGIEDDLIVLDSYSSELKSSTTADPLSTIDFIKFRLLGNDSNLLDMCILNI